MTKMRVYSLGLFGPALRIDDIELFVGSWWTVSRSLEPSALFGAARSRLRRSRGTAVAVRVVSRKACAKPAPRSCHSPCDRLPRDLPSACPHYRTQKITQESAVMGLSHEARNAIQEGTSTT